MSLANAHPVRERGNIKPLPVVAVLNGIPHSDNVQLAKARGEFDKWLPLQSMIRGD